MLLTQAVQGCGHRVKEGHGGCHQAGWLCALTPLYPPSSPSLSLSTFSRAQEYKQGLSIISRRCRVGSALHTDGIGWCGVDVVPCWGCVWGCSVGQHPLLARDTITCCLISHSECAASLPSPSGARCMGTSAHKPSSAAASSVIWQRRG